MHAGVMQASVVYTPEAESSEQVVLRALADCGDIVPLHVELDA